jgi:hypothetical protein
MLINEIITVCSENQDETHKYTYIVGENAEFLKVKAKKVKVKGKDIPVTGHGGP